MNGWALKTLKAPWREGRPWLLAAGLLGVALMVKLAWIGSYPVHIDELISLDAVRGIAEHGLPILETGKIYWRSLVSHYLLAIPYCFGATDLDAGRSVSLLFNILAAGYVLGIARTLESSFLPGGLAVVLFLSSSLINLNTYLLRDYAIFNFFALATAYHAYRHFIVGDGSLLPLFLYAPLLAGSHDMALGMVPVFVAGAGFACLKRPGYFTTQRWELVGLSLVLAVAFALFVLYRPGNAQFAKTALEMKLGGMSDKWFLAKEVLNFAPYALIGSVAGFIYGAVRRQKSYLFWGGVILWLGLFLSLVSPMANSRYFIHLVSLMIVYGACTAWRFCTWLIHHRRGGPPVVQALLFVILIITSLGVSNVSPGKVFGFSYRYLDAAPAHEYVAENLTADAILLSMQPGLSEYLLKRRPNYFLREKVVEPGKRWTRFSEDEKQYMVYPILDNVSKLEGLVTGPPYRSIYIIVDYLFDYALSPRMRYFIHSNFKLVYKDDQRYAVFLRKGSS